MEDNDEPITLSAHALAALAEFNAERDAHQSKFEELKAQAEDDAQLSMAAFTEDWNESQFWYSDETAEVLANELLEASNPNTRIGVVSAPSVFVALRNILLTILPNSPWHCRGSGYLLKQRKLPASDRPKLVLLEHDPRFRIFSEFVYYDFQQPLKLPNELKGSLDCIICDPPFLSEDCQTKAALTTRWLLKATESGSPKPRVIVCTGERMRDLVTRVYRPLGVLSTTYEPRHAKGLSNEFYCYANFECSSWVWKT